MRKNLNHREIIKNMVLLRKHNTITASLKYLKKPTNEIIHPLKLKVGSMQMQMSVGSLAHGNNFYL